MRRVLLLALCSLMAASLAVTRSDDESVPAESMRRHTGSQPGDVARWNLGVRPAPLSVGDPLLALGLGDSSQRPTGTEADDAAFRPGRVIVHGAGGSRLQPDAFGGALPRMVERYVTESGALARNYGAIEPTSGFGPEGDAFYISGGDGTDLRPRVLRSKDDGITWENVSPRFLPEDGPRLSGVDEFPPMTNDPYLHVDPVTGRVFSYNQDSWLFCDYWDISPDGGKTWRSRQECDGQYSFGDHPTITTGRPTVTRMKGYPNIVYFCAAMDGSMCRRSLDGGETFGRPILAMDKGMPTTGHVATGPDGTVYLPHLGANAAWVAVSRDDGKHWETVKVDDTVWTRPNKYNTPSRGFARNNHDASVAVDAAGNAYYFWLGDDSLPYLSVSRDDGRTWSVPRSVAAPGVTAANFQEIVAGRRGRIAFLYLGTRVPGGFEADPAAYEEAKWSAYVGFSVNALARRPTFATTTAHPPSDPVRRGDCANRCMVDWGVTGAGELRDGMYDFLDIDINPASGRVWVSLVDLCNVECGGHEGVSENGGEFSMAAVGVQTRGVRVGPRGIHWR